MARPGRGIHVMPEPNETATRNGSPDPSPDGSVPGTAGPPDDVERGRRARGRWILGGFCAGIVLAYVVTAVRVAWQGWRILPYMLISDLIWAPIIGAQMGIGFGYWRHPDPRKGRRFWRRPRFRMLTMMILIAYIALLFGMGVSTAPIGEAARNYEQRYLLSAGVMEVYRGAAAKYSAQVRQKLAAAAELRSGRIPDDLAPSQKAFLRSLDPRTTPELRKERYEQIATVEERGGKGLEPIVAHFRKFTAYHEALADKYDRARRRPWLPVEPDPPLTPAQ
jgi:hypothetical protein